MLRLQRGAEPVKLFVLGATAALAIAACASRRDAQTMPAQAAPVMASPQHDEITRLAQEIETERGTLGLPASPAHAMSGGNGNAVECTRSAASTCAQSCTLSDSICDNAKKICDLAKQLPGDAWADQKCSDGTATCDQAKAACCACS